MFVLADASYHFTYLSKHKQEGGKKSNKRALLLDKSLRRCQGNTGLCAFGA